MLGGEELGGEESRRLDSELNEEHPAGVCSARGIGASGRSVKSSCVVDNLFSASVQSHMFVSLSLRSGLTFRHLKAPVLSVVGTTNLRTVFGLPR